MKTTILGVLILGLAAALTAFAGGGSSGASGVYFDHGQHADLDCADCHAAASTSRLGTDLLLPEKDSCASCHDVESPSDCGVCHVDADDPYGYAERVPGVDRFSHAAHVDAGMECAACHGPVTAIVAQPAKSECRTCHVTASDLQDCSVCHTQGAEYVPSDHGPGWEYWHGIDAGFDQQDCMNCHAQVDCQDCHAGDNVRPRVHRLNFAFDHSVEARAAEVECATCHVDNGFCAACHTANRVLPRSHSRGDWLLPGGDGGYHAIEARFEMEACISCHDTGDQSPLCASCHGM